tara:strand:- start:1708 stop:3156 length:1449 start_codon:yes stop_codon:yes gene_type:complete
MDVKGRNNLLIFFVSAIYLSLIACFLPDEKYSILLIPFILGVVFLPFLNIKYLFYLVVFLTPLSVSLSDLGLFILDTEMAFPTEPILFGFMILTIFQISNNTSLFKPILQHPITFFMLIYLLWMFITCITSSMPLVSFKILLTRLWYILPIFFMGSIFFQKKTEMSKFILLYTTPLVCVVLYTVLRHSSYFFDKESAHYMMSPFFNDHTSYGGVIAFFLPFVFALFWLKKENNIFRMLLLFFLLILIIGLILSFTRAAWISLFISMLFALLLKLQINRKVLFCSPFLLIAFLFVLQSPIIDLLQSNRQDSSDNLIEHVTSISNISTDASNMERINRWKCAVKMFIEKPYFGWGPGTYQFQYARFQLSKDRTIISSNSGDMGNAHSEYLGPLCESGFIGFLLFISLVLFTIIRSINMYYESSDNSKRIWLLAIIIALMSYFIHGLFNNFLDTDKASVAVWGSFAMLVALDLMSHKKQSHSLSI